MENADGSRQELYRLDLWNATAAPETLDWHEMDNLVAAEPERATKMAYSLHAWLASLPAGPAWAPNAGCQGFAFPTGAGPDGLQAAGQAAMAAVGSAAAMVSRPQDSDPDW